MADIVLKDRYNNSNTYTGVETVTLNKSGGGTQTFTAGIATDKRILQTLNFGNSQSVTVGPNATGNAYDFMRECQINKPGTLKAENIKNGITIAGTTGTYPSGTDMIITENGTNINVADQKTVSVNVPQTPTQTKTISKGSYDFSSSMTVSPDSGYTLNSVVLEVPENLKEENIRRNTTIAGVTGTLGFASFALVLSEPFPVPLPITVPLRDAIGCMILSYEPDRTYRPIYWLDSPTASANLGFNEIGTFPFFHRAAPYDYKIEGSTSFSNNTYSLTVSKIDSGYKVIVWAILPPTFS